MTMGKVGENVSARVLFVESPSYDVNFSSSTANSSSSSSRAAVASTESTVRSLFDPCVEAISKHVCISYAQLSIVCIACFIILLMICVRTFFCCVQRRLRRKRTIDILDIEANGNHTRHNSISEIAGHPPPRYSQIFDQDGISVFEEAPPDYETAQPDLLKSLTNLSRTSSLAKEQSEQESGNRRSAQDCRIDFGISGTTSSVKASVSDKQKQNPCPKTGAIKTLSIDELIKNSKEEYCI